MNDPETVTVDPLIASAFPAPQAGNLPQASELRHIVIDFSFCYLL
jgi:hypothetical protein